MHYACDRSENPQSSRPGLALEVQQPFIHAPEMSTGL